MIRAYKYLFYKLYLFERMMFDPVPGCTAFSFLLLIQFFNLFALFLLLDRCFGISFPFRWSSPEPLCGIVLLAVPQYFFLMHRDKFRLIVREFGHENERQNLIGGLVVGAYVVFSLIFFFWAVLLPPKSA